MSGSWLTWANALTLARLACIPGLVLAILFADWDIAAGIFIFAIFSDLFDGLIARRLNQTSPLGGLFDHGTDALLVTAACAGFAWLGVINALLPVLIPLAFTQYLADSRILTAHSQSGRRLLTSRLGRYNGVAYYVVAGAGVGLNLLGLVALLPAVGWLAWLLVASTLASMTDRAIMFWRITSDG